MTTLRFATSAFAALIMALGCIPAHALNMPTTLAPGTSSARVLIARAPRAFVTDLGHASATTPVRVAVVMKYRHVAELHQFVALQGQAQKLPRTLTAQQFLNYFAPTAADYQQAAMALQSAGFTITRTYQNRTVIDAVGPAAAAERMFGTEIHMVRQRDGAIRYANLRPAYLPDSSQADGLRRRGPRQSSRAPHGHGAGQCGPHPCEDRSADARPRSRASAHSPYRLHTIYPCSTRSLAGNPARPTTVPARPQPWSWTRIFSTAICKAFLNHFHVVRTGPKTVRIPINGGPPPGLIYPDSGETTLDVETIVSNAPGVALYVYEMDSLAFTSTIDAYNQVNSDDLVGVVNSSFGGCEDFTDPSNFPALANHLALQGSALGIVYDASSGDSGSNECGFDFSTPQGVSSPASGTHFVAVGGTTLFPHLDGSYSREVGWWGSGGGVSDIFPMPAYQTGVKNMVPKWRNLPDVAFDADPNSGTSLFISGGWFGPIGGTSLAAPIFTALVAELDQYGHCRIGNIHPALYRNYKLYGYTLPAGAAIYHDAIGQFNGFYLTTPGYDNVTGIGSIDGWNFAVTTHL